MSNYVGRTYNDSGFGEPPVKEFPHTVQLSFLLLASVPPYEPELRNRRIRRDFSIHVLLTGPAWPRPALEITRGKSNLKKKKSCNCRGGRGGPRSKKPGGKQSMSEGEINTGHRKRWRRTTGNSKRLRGIVPCKKVLDDPQKRKSTQKWNPTFQREVELRWQSDKKRTSGRASVHRFIGGGRNPT